MLLARMQRRWLLHPGCRPLRAFAVVASSASLHCWADSVPTTTQLALSAPPRLHWLRDPRPEPQLWSSREVRCCCVVGRLHDPFTCLQQGVGRGAWVVGREVGSGEGGREGWGVGRGGRGGRGAVLRCTWWRRVSRCVCRCRRTSTRTCRGGVHRCRPRRGCRKRRGQTLHCGVGERARWSGQVSLGLRPELCMMQTQTGAGHTGACILLRGSSYTPRLHLLVLCPEL
jgi:hypothetical protein